MFSHQRQWVLSICIVMLIAPNSRGQYYPAYPRVHNSLEKGLLQDLKTANTAFRRIRIYLDLASLYYHKPSQRKADFSKAKEMAEKAVELSLRSQDQQSYNKAQLLLAEILMMKDEETAAEKLLETVKDTARVDMLLCLAYNFDVLNDDNKGDYPKAKSYAEEARQASIRLKLPDREVVAARISAMVSADQNEKDAEKKLMDVLALYKQKAPDRLHYIYNLLHIYHLTSKKTDKEISYSQETLKSMETSGDTLAASDFYAMHANVCIGNEDFKLAVQYIDRALEGFRSFWSRGSLVEPYITRIKVIALRGMGDDAGALKFLTEMERKYPPESPEKRVNYLNQIGNMNRRLKNYREAEKYLLQAVSFKHDNTSERYEALRRLGEVYIDTRRYTEAKPYLNKAFNQYGTIMSQSVKSHVLYMLYLADSATGDYLSAIKRLSADRDANEASVREAKIKISQELNIKYETERKESELKIKEQDIRLLQQTADIQNIKLRQSKLTRNITIAAAGIFILVSFLLYRQYQTKQKQNRIISGQNKEITEKNEQLSHLVSDKEMLLKEVHHRVKNNLQIMMSLLESQSHYLESDALRAVEDSKRRIYAMSLIHQKLYQSEDIKTVDMSAYIREFVHYLRESFDTSNRIVFLFEAVPVELSVTQAIPLALIANEAVTNAIKYAFPSNMRGEIKIALTQLGDEVEMVVADNGIGMSQEFMQKNSSSLGVTLMRGLTDQIKGKIFIESAGGTCITVRFHTSEFSDIHISGKEFISESMLA